MMQNKPDKYEKIDKLGEGTLSNLYKVQGFVLFSELTL